MAPLVPLTSVHSTVVVDVMIVIALVVSNVIPAAGQEHPLRQMQLEIPEGAVMVECRFNVSNLVLVNMSERGQPHNVFAGVKERRCERLLTFSHCRFTEDSVTLWAVFTNVTVAAARTVFCNQTTIADDTTVDKSFNITLGDYITPAPDIGTTTVATTEKATAATLQASSCPLNEASTSSVSILLVAVVVVLAVLTSHQRLPCK
ncbi:uncharacterized protein LOC112569458 [Pomacea canaliculata]|uniref:uncharacterized protein LOC112569458 n=1 Tax=Pomacea canaliculata TaxID=400727 RepID=UPI000D728A30|nr:uncharacterized protein LOC112569458 [Pomacea canaliculata]